jgi:hypothetical protein
MRASRMVLGLIALFSQVGCSHQVSGSGVPSRNPPAAHSAEGPHEADVVLHWLQSELHHARAPLTDYYVAEHWRAHDVSTLVGTTRGVIAASLGEPDCPSRAGGPCPFGAGRVAYSFFTLGVRMGGGPTLVLGFDQNVCASARWVLTK